MADGDKHVGKNQDAVTGQCKLQCTSESPGGLVNTQMTVPPAPRVSHSAGLEQGPRT